MDRSRFRKALTPRVLSRVLLAFALVGAGVLWAMFGPVRADSLRAAIEGSPAAPAIYILVLVLANLLFIPRTIVAIAGGLMFGVGWGVLWTTIGTTLGAALGFLTARYMNTGANGERLVDPEGRPRFGPILLKVEQGGWRAVAMVRLVPVIPASLANYAMGLTRLSFASYIVGTIVGQLPMTVASVDFGAAGARALAGKPNWLEPTLIGVGALAVSLLLPRLIAWRARAASPPPARP